MSNPAPSTGAKAAAPAPTPAALGRPRGFVPATALQAALDVFWRQGFEATSLDDLTAAMGLSRSSFYACFGSKPAVLLAALQAYADACYAALVAIAAAEAEPRAAVRAMLTAIADPAGGDRGCFFVNSVAELAPHNAELAALAQCHLGRVDALLTATLRRGGGGKARAAQRSGALLAMAVGITVLRKAGLPAAQLKRLLAQAEPLLSAA